MVLLRQETIFFHSQQQNRIFSTAWKYCVHYLPQFAQYGVE